MDHRISAQQKALAVGKRTTKYKLHMRLFSFFILICLTALSCDHVKERSTSSSSAANELKSKRFDGTWRLIEFADLDSATNQWIYPLGRHPKGVSIYTEDSIFNVTLSSEHPLQVPEDSVDTYSVNLMNYIQHYGVGFFGTYSIDIKHSKIIHHVEGGTNPFYIGTDQPRPFILKNDTLIIGDNITWKRVLVRAN